MLPSIQPRQYPPVAAVRRRTPGEADAAPSLAVARHMRQVASQAGVLSQSQAAIRIQHGWRQWTARVAALKARAAPGQTFVSTRYLPRNVDVSKKPIRDLAQFLGMLNFIPVDGSGPVLSAYMKRYKRGSVGSGGFSEVDPGPRGYIARYPREGKVAPAIGIHRSVYADLKSFVGVDQVNAQLQIARDAGLNIHSIMFDHRFVIPVHQFEHASQDLMTMHSRGMTHNDIKLDNMVARTVGNKLFISFIDCDRISGNTRQFLPTFNRLHIKREMHDPHDSNLVADDEYAFLRMLMTVSDPVAYRSCMPRDRSEFTADELKRVKRHSQVFVDRHIKPKHKDEVKRFLYLPVLKNCLRQPLHLMIDWERKRDLIAAMNLGNALAVRTWGTVLLDACKTPEERCRILYAENADGIPGLYYAKEDKETSLAWLELVWTLPAKEQIILRRRLFDHSVADINAGVSKRMWFLNQMLPIRAPK